MSAGTLENAGPVVSTTVILNDFVDVLLLASWAVQFTVVWPSGNVDPEAGVQVSTGAGSVSSVAVAVYVTTAPPGPVASRVMSAGTVITGGVVSACGVTVTLNVACELLPRVSEAVQVTVVWPIGNVDPDAGLHVTGRLPSTMSVAVGLV